MNLVLRGKIAGKKMPQKITKMPQKDLHKKIPQLKQEVTRGAYDVFTKNFTAKTRGDERSI